jgi:hypothetical protein
MVILYTGVVVAAVTSAHCSPHQLSAVLAEPSYSLFCQREARIKSEYQEIIAGGVVPGSTGVIPLITTLLAIPVPAPAVPVVVPRQVVLASMLTQQS